MVDKIRGRILEILAFVGGFSLMAYEMVAARLLAPTIGSSTYVWTSVIGVIIAALSIGYFMGGKLADARNKDSDVAWLHIFAAAAILWTLLSYEWVLSSVAGGVADSRLQGVAASLFLFVPASLILGAISPYLVKLKIKSLKTSGSSAASLSAWNSIGGIVGTFTAGFILFGFIGSRESLVIFIALLLVASWFSAPMEKVRARLLVVAAVAAVALLAWFHQSSVDRISIDTPSANYRVLEVQSMYGPANLLSTGPAGTQSGVYLDNPDELVFWYTQEIARAVAAQEERDNILVLGGGAYTLPRYLASTYPESQIDTVEIDPELINIARDFFVFKDIDNHRAISSDARVYANQSDTEYDIVIVDVYGDISVPFSLMTKEYGDSINKLLKPGGVAIVNIIASFADNCRPIVEATHAVYANHLDFAYYLKNPSSAANERSNIIAIYSDNEQDLIDFEPRGELEGATLFTDNFMPAERLNQQCSMR